MITRAVLQNESEPVITHTSKNLQDFPDKFSKIPSLRVVDLNKNICVERKFSHVHLQTLQVAAEIKKFCAYHHTEEIKAIERRKMADDIDLSRKFEDFAKEIRNIIQQEQQKLIC